MLFTISEKILTALTTTFQNGVVSCNHPEILTGNSRNISKSACTFSKYLQIQEKVHVSNDTKRFTDQFIHFFGVDGCNNTLHLAKSTESNHFKIKCLGLEVFKRLTSWLKEIRGEYSCDKN